MSSLSVILTVVLIVVLACATVTFTSTGPARRQTLGLTIMILLLVPAGLGLIGPGLQQKALFAGPAQMVDASRLPASAPTGKAWQVTGPAGKPVGTLITYKGLTGGRCAVRLHGQTRTFRSSRLDRCAARLQDAAGR